jgi:FlaA1/EpsC-like NDP-sugar epimerase
MGTLNVLKAAERHGCTRFVNISTDKAADPTSVLGNTKRLAEQLTAWYAERTRLPYLSVRFGNVLGSRGSVLHTFTQQIRAGGPVTVTHPDITRFFMTIPEACELTVQAGAIGGHGEVLVLNMGEPVKILEVAKRLVARAGRDVEIVFTGLRTGEKLHEVLFSAHEMGVVKHHPLISHVPVLPISPSDLMMAEELGLRRSTPSRSVAAQGVLGGVGRSST